MRALKIASLAGLGFAIAFGGWLFVAYRADLSAARARIASGSEVAETRCGPIEYALLGRGPAILLVHGAGGGFDQMLDSAGELAARGFRVVVPSRFGYLRTPLRPDATPAAQADAHACLLDALKIARAAVVGVSAGAPSSMQLAIRHPQRVSALVLLVPLAYAPQTPERFATPSASGRWLFERAVDSDFLFWLGTRLAPGAVQDKVLGTPGVLVARAEPSEQARIAGLMRQPLPLSARRDGLLNDTAIAMRLPRYELERIEAPALVISSRDDLYGTFTGSVYTAQHIPGARFLGLPDGGHLWVGHHREVMAEIVSFIATSAR